MLNAFGLDNETLENKFRGLRNDIKLIFFTQEAGCPHCKDARTLFETVASITHKIAFDSFNFAIDAEKDREYHIIAVPALAINCPYSLPVAKLALKLAIAGDDIKVDIIHADEFLELAQKYNVRGLPMTVVNEKKSFYGALDEEEYVHRIIELA